ncbi:GNAT family N-acetyltransferase [Kitasatospora sp. NPDC059646]|uniref:GNAT family N-acetyltransferase n=1 Tax=Kitasatospora sp. NPDC059646 TaxID=3346893 RepID=UPI0036C18694
MTNEVLLHTTRRRWEALAGAPAAFPEPGRAAVVVSPRSGLCPPGWLGLVTLGGSVLATAPDERRARLLRAALREHPADLAGDAERLRPLLPIGDLLGPATLSYLAPDALLPHLGTVHQLPGDDPGLRDLEQRTGVADAEESGLAGLTSPVFAVLAEDGRVLAACGYRTWPFGIAHLGVLTDPAHRARGLARRAASPAARHALAAGLLPQWRARIPASRRVAARLGFRELGTQLSLFIR